MMMVEPDYKEDDALSFCDLPIYTDSSNESFIDSSIQSSSEQSTDSTSQNICSADDIFFEFFNDSTSQNMCSADDIFLCGKLVPFKDQQPPNPKTSPSVIQQHHPISGVGSDNGKTRLTRTSRSLDYRRGVENERSSSTQSEGKLETFSKRTRWYEFMFGMQKYSNEMLDLKDIKNRRQRQRQRQRQTQGQSTIIPALEVQSGSMKEWKGSWRVINALSCKDQTSISSMTPSSRVIQGP